MYLTSRQGSLKTQVAVASKTLADTMRAPGSTGNSQVNKVQGTTMSRPWLSRGFHHSYGCSQLTLRLGSSLCPAVVLIIIIKLGRVWLEPMWLELVQLVWAQLVRQVYSQPCRRWHSKLQITGQPSGILRSVITNIQSVYRLAVRCS